MQYVKIAFLNVGNIHEKSNISTKSWAEQWVFSYIRENSINGGERVKSMHKFPEKITHTSLRPDIVLWSKGTKQVVLIELTVLLFSSANKMDGKPGICRGFGEQALWRTLGLQYWRSAKKRLVAKVTKQAEIASWWIWITWNQWRQCC